MVFSDPYIHSQCVVDRRLLERFFLRTFHLSTTFIRMHLNKAKIIERFALRNVHTFFITYLPMHLLTSENHFHKDQVPMLNHRTVCIEELRHYFYYLPLLLVR